MKKRFGVKRTLSVRNKGFGIMETVIAIGILIAVLGTSVALARFSVRASADSQTRITAYNYAQQRVELIRWNRDNSWLGQATQWCVPTYSESKTWVNPPIVFGLVATCTDVSNDLKKIKVTVTWQDRGTEKSVILETKLANWKQF